MAVCVRGEAYRAMAEHLHHDAEGNAFGEHQRRGAMAKVVEANVRQFGLAKRAATLSRDCKGAQVIQRLCTNAINVAPLATA